MVFGGAGPNQEVLNSPSITGVRPIYNMDTTHLPTGMPIHQHISPCFCPCCSWFIYHITKVYTHLPCGQFKNEMENPCLPVSLRKWPIIYNLICWRVNIKGTRRSNGWENPFPMIWLPHWQCGACPMPFNFGQNNSMSGKGRESCELWALWQATLFRNTGALLGQTWKVC